MKILCHPIHDGHPPDIRPAEVERAWMEATPERFAYRCLPLNIANTLGWTVHAPEGFIAVWSGGVAKEAINIVPERPETPMHSAVSHFGSGVLTFHVAALFRTPPDVALFVSGPINQVTDGIQALTGIVETDWSTATFTMNWRFTRANHPVVFRRGDPICQIFPIDLTLIERIDPEFARLRDDAELAASYDAWQDSRLGFNKGLTGGDAKAIEQGWQRDYFKGRTVDGRAAPVHRTRLRVRPFADPAAR